VGSSHLHTTKVEGFPHLQAKERKKNNEENQKKKRICREKTAKTYTFA